jgi:hypothetical protein
VELHPGTPQGVGKKFVQSLLGGKKKGKNS